MRNNGSSIAVFLTGALLAGCAGEPPRRAVEAQPIVTRVMVNPAHGQSAAQLDRDRYECHLWAVRKSRFDPSAPGIPDAYRVRVESASGTTTIAGALTGAVLGAVVASPGSEGAGAVVGAIAGGAMGAAVDQDRLQRQAYQDRRLAPYRAGANAYRRAISACLDGRGYTTN